MKASVGLKLLKVRWEAVARQQARSATDYIAERDQAAALRLESAIQASIERMQVIPQAGRPGRIARTREWIVTPNYIIIYRLTRRTIDIVRFLHARQRYP